MITLYHMPRTRSARFIFLLEELGAPYELHKVADIRRGDGSGAADPANPHPHGKVPAISDDGVVVFESAAIALYLTDKFPANGIGPLVDDPRRGAYLSWLAYYAGVMEPAFISKYMKIEAPRPMAGWANADDVMGFVNATLEKAPFLLGEKFSAVDLLVGTTFAMFMGSPLLAKTAPLEAYVQRVTERPAMARAKAKEAAPG
jgi:glutathione S-transferase